MRRTVLAIGLFAVLVIGGSGGMLMYLTHAMDGVRTETITAVDIGAVADGTYRGEYVRQRFSVTVDVTVTDGAIDAVNIVRDLRFKDETVAAILFERMIEENRLDVDVVSGATLSSISYQKAVEHALKGDE
ncbi:MAG: FMN-binding protein [Acholeplasmatales bacterium]|nr:MAG: FMN-binding protein [Acholeplasmatales bacterium]